MQKTKILTLVYFFTLLVSTVILLNTCFAINNLLKTIPVNSDFASHYGSLQKNAGIQGIVSFMVLLLIGLVLYYLSSKRTYIILSNILYITLILFVFVSTNQNYFTAQNLEYSEKSEYWLTVFMGIFYIIGAVLVSAIGYITLRNYTKRAKHALNKSS